MPNAHALPSEVAEDPYVLHGRPLIQGAALTQTARFSDDVWPVGLAVLQRSGRSQSLHFGTIPAEHRLEIKLVCYAALSGDIPAHEDRPGIQTILSMQNRIRHLSDWLSTFRPGVMISDLRPHDLDDYQIHLIANVRSPWQRHALRTAVAYLWRYRSTLGARALGFDPRLTAFWSLEPYPGKRTENATSRIPEAVHAPLLVWATRFVDDFSQDIIDATTLWHARKAKSRVGEDPHRRQKVAWGQAPSLVRAYLAAAEAARRPLPGSAGRPNMSAIARAAGCNPLALSPFATEIAELAATLGVSEYADLDQRINGRLDGRPWILGFRTNPHEVDSLSRMSSLLQTACYIVIAFLSGMRDSEIKHLQTGAAECVADSQGTPMRWFAHSLAFKGEEEVAGVPAMWIIGEPAARAIRVLERLTEASGSPGPWLFIPLGTGPGRGSGARNSNEVLTVAGTNLALNRFRDWVNGYCHAHNREDGIPNHDGQPWRLTTRQFRRTLAWYIARRPGGAIAGAIAYRHHSIQMFEGYAGTSDSGFRAEVEAEQALARGEHLLAMIERTDHLQLAGPAADEAHARLSELSSNGVYAGTVQTDPRRFLRLLKTRGPQVYPGHYVTCIFDASKAQCQKTPDGPDLETCQPLTCQNVALTEDNLSAWRSEIVQIDADLTQRPALPPLLIDRLRQRRARILSRLNGNSDDSTS